jgi:MoaA/NifB/PqqE/SkfB family radical SAM enzyme
MPEGKDLYCALAFNSISFGSHGGSRPCCAVDTYFWSEIENRLPQYDNKVINWFNNERIVSLRKDLLNKKWNPICNMCRTREQHGQASTREIFNYTLSEIEKNTERSWRNNDPIINNLNDIFLLDITVGNKCNSACLMCNSSASSLWAKEQEEITGTPAWHGPDINWFSEEHVPELIDHLPNLKAIQFAGGEPTISEPHIFLLKRLIEQNRAKDITLGYVTNLTGISDELLELWDHFNTKHITVSIDGVGSVNEYQRFPFTWKKVVSQLNQVKTISKERGNYHIGLSHTITSLNILKFDELIKWWELQVNEGCGILSSLPHIQCVTNPSHLDPVYMPKEMKKDVNEMLYNFEYYLKDHNLISKYKSAIDNIRTNVLNREIADEVHNNEWNKLRDFVQPLDKYRNRHILEYLPYMKKYWKFR